MDRVTTIPAKGTSETRIGRFSECNRIYHVTTVTHQRSTVFNRLANGRAVVKAMKCEQECGGSTTLAFVVMPDHLHWLVQIDGSRSLSETVCVVKSGSARQINSGARVLRRIWQRGFHDHAVRREEDIVNIARYIVANPVRAGLVKSVWHYPLWDAVWV